MRAQIKLYDWAASPFSFKVRAVLEYKGLAYTRSPMLGPALLDVRRRGKIGKAPALEIDGRLFVDSTDIVYELERRFPDPPVIPAAPRERALCHALEDWCDEALYFIGLYYQWYEPEGRKMVPAAFGRSLLGRVACLYYQRLLLKQIKGHGTSRKPAPHVHSDLQRNLTAIEALVEPGPFLLGDGPFLCDFALLGQLVYLARTPVGADILQQHPAIDRYRTRSKALRRHSEDARRPAQIWRARLDSNQRPTA